MDNAPTRSEMIMRCIGGSDSIVVQLHVVNAFPLDPSGRRSTNSERLAVGGSAIVQDRSDPVGKSCARVPAICT